MRGSLIFWNKKAAPVKGRLSLTILSGRNEFTTTEVRR